MVSYSIWELIVPPWRILYRIAVKQVYVLSVLDSRQNIEDILLTDSSVQKYESSKVLEGS